MPSGIQDRGSRREGNVKLFSTNLPGALIDSEVSLKAVLCVAEKSMIPRQELTQDDSITFFISALACEALLSS